jgi:fatty acid-binding protein DegV
MMKIITDSTADLGMDIASEFNISVVPLSVFIGGKTYLDGIDLRP